MNCNEFFDHATRLSGDADSARFAAHLTACDGCREWFESAEPALTLFVAAGSGPEDGAPQGANAATSLAVDAPRASAWHEPLRRRMELSQTNRAAFLASGETTHPCAQAPPQVGRDKRWNQIRGRRVAGHVAQLAAMVVIVALGLSFLAVPPDQQQSAPHTPAALIDTNATLDSLGLVAACMEPADVELHSVTIAQGLGEIACCTRCHHPRTENFSHRKIETRPASLITDASAVKQIAESCLLCHNG